jgi:hypothetical protein
MAAPLRRHLRDLLEAPGAIPTEAHPDSFD